MDRSGKESVSQSDGMIQEMCRGLLDNVPLIT
jgi:hypothetical protein